LVNPVVNFANYDNNGDGYVDGIAVVHSGPGAELSGSPDDIWSHKWAIVPRLRDGVYIFNYSMEPEYWMSAGDMTIGVYCHEFGHAIGGLPDLYDTDGGSQGIGRWSVMAGGSWNGSLGSSPSHFDAWCKIEMGFAVAGVITTNQTGVNLPSVEQSNAGIFRLWTNGVIGPEYFLVENRQRTGYDASLPSSGLLIWHIDDTVSSGNTRPWYPPNSPSAGHYTVALVQSDNLFQLEKNLNSGNSGDPFPGSAVNRTFNSSTTPNSNGYAGAGSLVQVTNISNSGSTMTADFSVLAPTDVDDDLFNRPKNFQLSQNYPNPFNPATVISYSLEKSGPVELDIFNLLGEKVKTLVSGRQGAGLHQENWDGTDRSGRPVSSGLYLYRLRLEKFAETKKMMLVR
ncbi:MAG TPA: M6 family metalloprotease domain-containing protein, partial [candidate division Zixibacteria bacterium]|nr:M6 family metalloprotease domain-containing protein [candidate division Zixibacteria bacterium]